MGGVDLVEEFDAGGGQLNEDNASVGGVASAFGEVAFFEIVDDDGDVSAGHEEVAGDVALGEGAA